MALASAWKVKSVEHRLNFIWMIHTDNAATIKKSAVENESNSLPLTTSVSDLKNMREAHEVNFKDAALLVKANMHLDHIEAAIVICCQVKQ